MNVRFSLLFLFLLSSLCAPRGLPFLKRGGAQEPTEDQRQAETTGDAAIPVDQLKVLLRPLTKDELSVEAEQWLELLRSKIRQVTETEIEISALEASTPELTERLQTLKNEETELVERVKLVLSKTKKKGGDTETAEQFIAAVTDLENPTDTTSYRVAIIASVKNWAESEDGGKALARRVVFALLILLVFWAFSKFAGRVTSRLLARHPRASNLLEDFARRTAGGVVLIVGALMAMSVMGVEIGPMMAALGAGGFIVGFALQETLGSFASGLMIMVYRPFDVDDYVSLAGDEGTVKELSLVSTKLLTIDNKVVVVPNKKAWSDTIINYTGKEMRRVDLVFGISYDDDIRKSIALLGEIAASHPQVLTDHDINVRVCELADSSVNLFCRPWVKTEDYWTVYWDLTRDVKILLAAEGFEVPYQQRNVQIHGSAAS